MKILVVSCVFPPEPLVSARTSFDVAEYFHKIGDEVEVLCSRPNRNIDTADCNTFYRQFPFRVRNVLTYRSEKSTLASRFLENIVFGISVFFKILFGKQHDVVYGNVWPMFSSALIGLACRIRRTKLILSVQDLYPDTLANQNKISRKSNLFRFFMFLERFCAKCASHVIVISDGFKDAFINDRGVKPEKISVIKNWQKSSGYQIINKAEAKEKLSKTLDVDLTCTFLYVYGGNIGLASGILDLVKAWVSSDIKSTLLVAGGGSLVAEVERLAHNHDNVVILSPWLPEQTSLVYSAADVLILPIAQNQESASVPSKLMGYMLSAKPILMSSFGESAAALDLQSAGGGVVVKQFDLSTVLKANKYFTEVEEKVLQEFGTKNLNFAKNNYDEKIALSKVHNVISMVLKK